MNPPVPDAPFSVPPLPWYRCLWADPSRTLRAAVTFLLGLAVAWSVGASDFGYLHTGLAIAAILSTLATLGIDKFARADLAKNPAETNTFLGTSMALRGIAGVVGYFLLVLLAPKNVELKHIWLVLGLLAITQTPLALGWWYEVGAHRRIVRLAQNCSFALTSLFLFGLICRGASTVWFAAALVFEQPICALILFGAHLKIAPYEDMFTWDFIPARAWLRAAAKPLGLALLPLAVIPINQLLALWLSSEEQTGEFALSVRFYEFGLFVVLTILIGRKIARSAIGTDEFTTQETSLDLQYHQAAKLGWLLTLITIAVSAGLIRLFLNTEYRAAFIPTIILGLALVPAALGWVRDERLLGLGLEREIVRFQIAGALVNLPFALLGIHFLGAIGAALATTISIFATNLIATRFSVQTSTLSRPQSRALILTLGWESAKPAASSIISPTGKTIAPFPNAGPATDIAALIAASRPPMPVAGRPSSGLAANDPLGS